MKYIVLDFEFNQAFDFGSGKSRPSDERCPFEIIQIGAVRLNSRFKYEASLNLLIKPAIYKKIHPYVGRMTGLSGAALRNKQSFSEAFLKLSEFAGKKKVIYCVWGVNDIKELKKNVDYHGLSAAMQTIDFIDVQNIASRHLNHISGMCIGLKNALLAMNIEANKPFHNALYDAEYTAKILQRLKSEPLHVKQFSSDNVITLLKPPAKMNFAVLYKLVEDTIGRALTVKEKWVFKNVYAGIKLKRFDK